MQKALFSTKSERLHIDGRVFREVTFEDLEIFQDFNKERERIVQFVSSNYMLQDHPRACG